jgi:predicted outer membrane repeat protein
LYLIARLENTMRHFARFTIRALRGAILATDLSGYNPTLTQIITNSTFSGNSATSGGGVWSSRTQTITNSTFSGNIATDSGSNGGAVWQDAETLNIANNIMANSVSGDDCHSTSSVAINLNNLIEQSTHCGGSLNVDPNLGALADNGGPTQTFALLANSPAIDAGDDTTCAAAPVSNLDQRGTARPNGGHCDIGAYEYVDTTAPSITVFDVPASPTSLNIPIMTFTVSEDAILTGYLITESATPPALNDAGWTASAPTTYPVASMGSYTLYPWAKDAAGHVSAVYGPASANITCLDSITVTSNADSGAGSLRQAIADTCAGGTITFNSSLSGDTIHLASTLTISKSLTIEGSSLASKITISGDTDPAGPTPPGGTGDVRVLQTTGHNSVTVALKSLIVTKGLTSGDGGGLLNDSITTITNSVFDGNTAANGGAIDAEGALTVINSTFSNNSSTDSNGGGGAIINNYTITDVHRQRQYWLRQRHPPPGSTRQRLDHRQRWQPARWQRPCQWQFHHRRDVYDRQDGTDGR